MNAREIALSNHAFFFVRIATLFCREDFSSAVGESTHNEDGVAQFALPVGVYPGYVRVDSSNAIKNCCHEGLRNNRILLGKVAVLLPNTVGGEMNTEAKVTCSGFVFDFKITKYERDGAHGFEMVEDPRSLLSDEFFGRFVELKISVVEC